MRELQTSIYSPANRQYSSIVNIVRLYISDNGRYNISREKSNVAKGETLQQNCAIKIGSDNSRGGNIDYNHCIFQSIIGVCSTRYSYLYNVLVYAFSRMVT